MILIYRYIYGVVKLKKYVFVCKNRLIVLEYSCMKQSPAIHFYNTLSRRVELFRPLKKGVVGLYTCGPTVYHYAHIGNLRTYIFEDILERALIWNGYRVDRVMNITDVGHLTGDADEGVDKLEKGAAAEQKSVRQIAKFYTTAFLKDMRALNIRVPKTIAPATKYVPDQITLIKQLFKKGLAYDTARAVYFNTAKFRNYGALAGQSLEQKSIGARSEVVTDTDKRHPADFALWFKAVGRFEHHILRWPSPWGVGFPGWHIECSAISKKFLGQPFDIHTGGVDLIGTHHTNEIAQSSGAYGTPLAHFWMHGEHLLTDNEKMAKSSENLFTLMNLVERGGTPLSYRYFALSAHYRTPLNFSWSALRGARNGFHALVQRMLYLEYRAQFQTEYAPRERTEKAREQFRSFVNNDLNIPQALGYTHTLLRDTDMAAKYPRSLLTLLYEFDEVFGLDLRRLAKRYTVKNVLKNKKLRALVTQREELRSNQQFMQSDRLRKHINDLGYVLEDTPNGSYVGPMNPEG